MARVAPAMAAGIVLGVLLTGCFTTSADFKNDAEDYIDSTVAEALEVDFTEVTCEDPGSQEVGTQFRCTATDTDGGQWEFLNTIDAENEYTVDLDRRP